MIPLPTLDAARAAIAPYMLAIKIGAAVLLLALVAVTYWRVGVWHDAYRDLGKAQAAQEAAEASLKAERDCRKGTDCAARIVRLQADGLGAVEKARQAAVEAAGREQAKRDADAKAAVERAARAASEAAVRAVEWKRRYESEKAARPECKAWSDTPLGCQR